MPELEDLIPSIWLRLPIKSSVRFRSVSKSWCASLSDPHFIYKNLTAPNEHDLLLLADLERQHYYSIASHETTLTATPLQVSHFMFVCCRKKQFWGIMPELEDLIPSIWLRLPIKSSVRFRSVSKSWCASLSDPHFIYKNLTAPNEHDLLLLADLERQHYYSIASHETTLTATPLQVSPPPPPPKVPVLPPGEFASVLSPPCDDMVCFHVLDSNSFVRSMGVWNLTTGETKMVPLLLIYENPYALFVTLGFGFDEKRKEYKIVQIVTPAPGRFLGYVYSLSSSTNICWRKVGEPKMLDSFGAYRAYSRSYKDGTFYWGLRDLIMSFDMSSEVFNPISFSPLQVEVGCKFPPYIKEICRLKEGSMLIITVNYRKGPQHTEYEIWALLDVGVKQSWSKLSVIDCGCEDDDEPFGFWRNELILRSKGNGRLSISDPFRREIRKIHIDEPYDISKCLAWTKKKRTVC